MVELGIVAQHIINACRAQRVAGLHSDGVDAITLDIGNEVFLLMSAILFLLVIVT